MRLVKLIGVYEVRGYVGLVIVLIVSFFLLEGGSCVKFVSFLWLDMLMRFEFGIGVY